MIDAVIKTELDGVFIINNKVYHDKRGCFIENYREDEFNSLIPNNIKFVQDNISKSHNKNVIRGLHYQLKYPQAKLVSVLNGAVLDVIVDIRKNSKTYGKYITIELCAFDGQSIFIPEGFAHGFRTLLDVDNIISYKTTNVYHPDDAYTIYWNDPFINIDWQFNNKENIIISESDNAAKCLCNIDQHYLPVVDNV